MRAFLFLIAAIAADATQAQSIDEVPGSRAAPARSAYLTAVVCLDGEAMFSNSVIMLARSTVVRRFEEIGIQLQWCKDTHHAGESALPVIVRFVSAALGEHPAPQHASALANTYLDGSAGMRVTVFYDRVGTCIGPFGTRGGRILGHLLAHEIGHALQGVARHSETGLMKAVFTRGDLTRMLQQDLAFTEFDGDLIRSALATRSRANSPASGI